MFKYSKSWMPSPHTNDTHAEIIKKVRLVWLDWARAFAVASIVFCHCTENTFNMSTEWVQSVPHWQGFMRDLLFTAGRLGVPVFLFLSGCLLLSRHPCRTFDDVLSFYGKKWFPLLRCWLFWTAIYAVIIGLGTQDAWNNFGRQLCLILYPPYSHSWYMPMIIGTYLAIPLLSMLIETGGRSLFYLLLAFSCFASLSKGIESQQFFATLLDMSFIGDQYVTYILLGYLAFLVAPGIGRGKAKFLAAAAILLCLMLARQYYAWHLAGMNVGLWYTDWRLIFCTFVLFLSFRLFDSCKVRLVTVLSKGAFAIYLMHNPVLQALKRAGLLLFSEPWLNDFLLFACTFSLSVLLFLVLSRVPVIARYLFLMK